MSRMDSTPLLSVLINAGKHREHGEMLLASLLAQDIVDQMEIIVFDSVEAGVPPLPGHDHPAVHYSRIDPETLFPAALARAIHQARAPIVALMEEHCIALPGWAAAMVEAHREPWGAVCGAVFNGNPGLGISDAEFLACRIIPWQAPAERAEQEMLDGHNSSYRREVLLAYGEEALTMMLASEAILLMRLRADGHRLLLEPKARYIHRNEASIKTLPRSLYYWHRSFGDSRAKVFGWSFPQRLKQVGVALLTPPYQCLRTLQYIREKRPDQLRTFWRNLPVVLLLGYSCTTGQIAGLLFGKGRSMENFSRAELGFYRPLTIDLSQVVQQ